MGDRRGRLGGARAAGAARARLGPPQPAAALARGRRADHGDAGERDQRVRVARATPRAGGAARCSTAAATRSPPRCSSRSTRLPARAAHRRHARRRAAAHGGDGRDRRHRPRAPRRALLHPLLLRRAGAPQRHAVRPAVGSTAEPDELRPPNGELLVAYLRAEPVGCGALKRTGPEPIDIKRMWLAESARGLGLGRRLLHELEERAARAGARTVRLETSDLCTRRSRSTAAPATRRCPPSTTSRSPTTGSRRTLA